MFTLICSAFPSQNAMLKVPVWFELGRGAPAVAAVGLDCGAARGIPPCKVARPTKSNGGFVVTPLTVIVLRFMIEADAELDPVAVTYIPNPTAPVVVLAV